MIAAWMLYSTALGMLIAGAAWLAEQIADRHGLPTRRIWSLGMVLAVALPIATILLKDAPAAVELNGALQVASPVAGIMMEGVDVLAVLDGGLGVLWMIGSVVMAALLLAGSVVSWHRRRGWTEARVDGVSVLLAKDVGPAVIGFLHSRIVLPRWALGADSTERRMMIRHEEEHVRAGDPRLILFSVLLLMTVPWNLALWYMAHRLRLAIEVDCDRRVVGGSDLDLRHYAELLLSVGMRRSVGAYGVGFSLGRPFLEQRIDRMTLSNGRPTRAATVLGLVGVLGVLCAAWALPQPVRAATVGHIWEMECPTAEPTQATKALLQAAEIST